MGNWLSTSAPTSDALVRSKSSYAYMKDLDSSVEKIKLELEEIKNHFRDWAKHTEVIVVCTVEWVILGWFFQIILLQAGIYARHTKEQE